MTRPAPGPAAPAGPGTAGRTPPADPKDRARWARWAASRWGIAAGAALLAIGLFAAFIRLSATYPVNSDGANIVLMAWDMLHGNVLLHGWDMSDVSFWTTELPQYVLVSWVRGLGPDVPHITAAMTYTLALVLAVLLANPRAAGPGGTGRNQRLARSLLPAGIMLAPQLGPGVFVLLLSVGHIGTAVPMLVAWLVLDRAPARWYRPATRTSSCSTSSPATLTTGSWPARSTTSLAPRPRPTAPAPTRSWSGTRTCWPPCTAGNKRPA